MNEKLSSQIVFQAFEEELRKIAGGYRAMPGATLVTEPPPAQPPVAAPAPTAPAAAAPTTAPTVGQMYAAEGPRASTASPPKTPLTGREATVETLQRFAGNEKLLDPGQSMFEAPKTKRAR